MSAPAVNGSVLIVVVLPDDEQMWGGSSKYFGGKLPRSQNCVRVLSVACHSSIPAAAAFRDDQKNDKYREAHGHVDTMERLSIPLFCGTGIGARAGDFWKLTLVDDPDGPWGGIVVNCENSRAGAELACVSPLCPYPRKCCC